MTSNDSKGGPRQIANWSPDLYRNAWNFASRVHDGQLVPGTGFPYINHLGAVAMEVISCFQHESSFDDPDLAVQCAILHDCMEDANVQYSEIESLFGKAVADGVAALTKDSSLSSKLEQMADSLDRIQAQPHEIWIVKMADRITNLQPPPSHWSQEKIEGYREEARLILESVGPASRYLSERLEAAILTYGIDD